MSNQWYPLGLQNFALGNIDFVTATIKVALIGAGYTFSSAHQYITDLGANIIARSGALAGATATNGVLNGNALTLSSVTGTEVTFVVLYKDTGSDATSPLLVYWDTATGLPVFPNGGDISVNWDVGPNKIASL